jgi:hypothetical protein
MCNFCEHGKMMAKKGFIFDEGTQQFVNKKTGKPAPANLQPAAMGHHHHHHSHEQQGGGSFFNY